MKKFFFNRHWFKKPFLFFFLLRRRPQMILGSRGNQIGFKLVSFLRDQRVCCMHDEPMIEIGNILCTRCVRPGITHLKNENLKPKVNVSLWFWLVHATLNGYSVICIRLTQSHLTRYNERVDKYLRDKRIHIEKACSSAGTGQNQTSFYLLQVWHELNKENCLCEQKYFCFFS